MATRRLDLLAGVGLALGSVFAMAGTFVAQPEV